MRIRFFCEFFTTRRGSWSGRACEFARRWVAEGDPVNVVTNDSFGEIRETKSPVDSLSASDRFRWRSFRFLGSNGTAAASSGQ